MRSCVLSFQEHCTGRSGSYANHPNPEVTYAFEGQFITIHIRGIRGECELIIEIFLESLIDVSDFRHFNNKGKLEDN